MITDQPVLAVLIDGDNTPASAAMAVMEELAGIGEIAVRRVYGDFTSSHLKKWSDVSAELALVPFHQPANTTGKNSSDIALVIDAMDLLHSGRFDGFVLVSSDSDFTRLASRIREQGKFVCGVGRGTTPDAFRQACQRFILIENLTVQSESDTETAKKKPVNHAFQLINNVLASAESEDGWLRLSRVGAQLRQRYPDFDVRSYGAANLSSLVAEIDKLELKGGGTEVSIRKK